MAALKCLCAMCIKNEQVSSAIASATVDGLAIPQALTALLKRDRTIDVQMYAAKW